MRKRTLVIILCLLHVLLLCGCKSDDYKNAVSAFEAGNYETAETAFTGLGDYKDSAEYLADIPYQRALIVLKSEDYAAARDAFTALGDYKDSQEKVTECDYQLAISAFEAGDYDAAETAFAALGDYKDSAEYLADIPYQRAMMMLADGDYQRAERAFALLDDYKDSKKMVLETKYQAAQAFLAAGDFDSAENLFIELESYRDSSYMVEDVRHERTYQEAELALNNGSYDEAAELFQTLNGFRDSADKAEEAIEAKLMSLYDKADSSFQAGEYFEAAEQFEQLGEYLDSSERAKDAYQAGIDSFKVERLEISGVEYEEYDWSDNRNYIFELTADNQECFCAVLSVEDEDGNWTPRTIIPVVDGIGKQRYSLPFSKDQNVTATVSGYLVGKPLKPDSVTKVDEMSEYEYSDWKYSNDTSCSLVQGYQYIENKTGQIVCSVTIEETQETVIFSTVVSNGIFYFYDYVNDLPYETRQVTLSLTPLLFCEAEILTEDDYEVIEPLHFYTEEGAYSNYYCSEEEIRLNGVQDGLLMYESRLIQSITGDRTEEPRPNSSFIHDGLCTMGAFEITDEDDEIADGASSEFMFSDYYLLSFHDYSGTQYIAWPAETENEEDIADLLQFPDDWKEEFYSLFGGYAEGLSGKLELIFFAYDSLENPTYGLIVDIFDDGNQVAAWEGEILREDGHLLLKDIDTDDTVSFLISDTGRLTFDMTFLGDGDVATMWLTEPDAFLDDILSYLVE